VEAPISPLKKMMAYYTTQQEIQTTQHARSA